MNLPVSVAALVLTLLVVRESRDPHPRRVDLLGMVSFTAVAPAPAQHTSLADARQATPDQVG